MNSSENLLSDVNPIKSYGDEFWKRHLKCLFFLKYVTVYVIDFFSEKHKFQELSIYLAGLYVSGINSVIIGSYTVVLGCSYLYPTDNIPYYLEITNSLSIYLHYFFPLLFIGNYRKAPTSITCICAMLNGYDLVMRIYDNTLCKDYKNTSFTAFGITFQARYQLVMSCICMYGWLVCLFVKHEIRYKFGLFYHIGNILKTVIAYIFFCKKCERRRKIIQAPFVYPLRVTFSGIFAFASAVFGMTFILLLVYKIYDLIDTLKSYKAYLEDEDHDYIFAVLIYYGLYNVTVGEAITILEWCIDGLEPIFPCFAIGHGLGIIIVLTTIWTMFYKYKEYSLLIRAVSRQSIELKWLWNFPPHAAINFPGQFIFNCVFLQNLIAISTFCSCYTACIIYYIKIDYLGILKSFSGLFWLSLVPLIISTIYFPHLTDDKNYIKNKRWTNMIDTWFLVLGFVGSAIKGIVRYISALVFKLISGFKPHISAYPPPYNFQDPLYRSFYAMIVVSCLRDRIIPEFPDNDKPEDYSNKLIYLNSNEILRS